MKYDFVKIVFVLLALIFFWQCENPNSYTYQRKLVINGELIAGQAIDSVYVTWSTDITERYDTEAQRVHNADVRINGVKLREYPDARGVYRYPDPNFRVQSGETYRIVVRAGSEEAYSETTVPPPFHFNAVGVAGGDTVKYVPGNSWFSDEFFRLEWYTYTASKIYRIISLADSATPENFIHDDRTEANVFKGKEEDRKNPSIWWAGENFTPINWMYFNWTGWHSIIVSAMDENYYNYRNGLIVGEQRGQNFYSVVTNGYGLFCSSASDTLRIYLVK